MQTNTNLDSCNRGGASEASRLPGLARLARSADSFDVYDRPSSHCKVPLGLLATCLGRLVLAGRHFVQELVTFPDVVGETTCVRTGAADRIVYAKRPGRHGFTRFVRNREPVPCRTVFLVLKRIPEGYLLVTAFVGDRPEPEPWDRHATPRSAAFWRNHALVWGSCEVLLGTETANCPWVMAN